MTEQYKYFSEFPRTEKLIKANAIIVDYIKDREAANSWRYIDFVKEDRFFMEIARDKSIDCESLTPEEIAEQSIEKIYN